MTALAIEYHTGTRLITKVIKFNSNYGQATAGALVIPAALQPFVQVRWRLLRVTHALQLEVIPELDDNGVLQAELNALVGA